MSQLHGQTVTQMRAKALTALLADHKLVRALAVQDEDFLTAVPDESTQALLDDPQRLLWDAILPYRKDYDQQAAAKPILSLSFEEINRISAKYASGHLYLYIFIPTALEKTTYGRRSDYLADRIEAALLGAGINKLTYFSRGDRAVYEGCTGHYVAFETTEFHF